MASGHGNRRSGSAFCTVKYLFIVFNVLVWLLGFGVLSVGVWLQINRGPYMTLLPTNNFLSATVLCIVAGAFILIIGFCGCCGAMMENQCMLIVYFVFVLIIFGLEVAATALGLSYKSEIKSFVHQEVLLTIQQEYDPAIVEHQQEGVVAVVDSVQQDLQCCGVDNLTDWYNIEAWPGKESVPSSCCIEPVEGCGDEGSNAALNTRGCMKEIEYWFIQNMYTMGILGLALTVIQILAMASAIGLFCCLRKNKYLL